MPNDADSAQNDAGGDDESQVGDPLTTGDDEPVAAVCACSFPSVCDAQACASPQGLWTALGTSSTGIRGGTQAISNPSTVFDDAGMPIVAWTAGRDNTTSVFVVRWNGTTWDDFGTLTQPQDNPVGARLARMNDTLILTWIDGQRSYLVRWSGDSWTEVGGSATGNGLNLTGQNVIYPTSPAIADDGTLYVTQSIDRSIVQVLRWTGAAWDGLDNSNTVGINSEPNIGASAMRICNNRPTVVWTNDDGTSDIYLKQWDGAAWSGLAGSATGEGLSDGADNAGASDARIACNTTALWVVWWELPGFGVYTKRYSGGDWTLVGGSTTGNGQYPDIALTVDGIPLVAWNDLSRSSVVLRSWDGSAWAGYQGEDRIFSSYAFIIAAALDVSSTGDVFVTWVASSEAGLGAYGSIWR